MHVEPPLSSILSDGTGFAVDQDFDNNVDRLSGHAHSGHGSMPSMYEQGTHLSTTPSMSLQGIQNNVLDHDAPLFPPTARRQPRIENGYMCEYPRCGRVFDRATDRNRHQSDVNTPEIDRPFRCYLCDKGFLYQEDLKRHEDTSKHNLRQVNQQIIENITTHEAANPPTTSLNRG